MLCLTNYQRIKALFILMIVGVAFKIVEVSCEIMIVSVLSVDYCNFRSCARVKHCEYEAITDTLNFDYLRGG